MKIIFLIHHEKSLGYSMSRYVEFLSRGLQKKGHKTEIWAPKLYLSKLEQSFFLNKWLRYIDQFLLFPIEFKVKSYKIPKSTLFVLIDQALSIWMPLIKNKKHVVHCHDFIALKAAKGIIKENPTGWTGKMYQFLILTGLKKANNYISISKNTALELEDFLEEKPMLSEQIYNALNSKFVPGDVPETRRTLGNTLQLDLTQGYILHVGGDTFYKNKKGVVAVYNAWRSFASQPLPLLLVGGTKQSATLQNLIANSPYVENIHILENVEEQFLLKAYQGATVMLYPSLYEGFGWPIAEALASGCPVITTDTAPMNEVGGDAAFYVKRSDSFENSQIWADTSAKVIDEIIGLNPEQRKAVVQAGLDQISIFHEKIILDQIEKVYERIIKNSNM